MLGVTDVLLKDATDEPNQLSTKLCPQLLKVLFQLWIRSQSMNDGLWKSLASLMNGWRHRMPTIYQYNAVTQAFTLRVARFLYLFLLFNPLGYSMVLRKAPIPLLSLNSLFYLFNSYTHCSDSIKTSYDLSNQYTFYAWYRVLRILFHLLSYYSLTSKIYWEILRVSLSQTTT